MRSRARETIRMNDFFFLSLSLRSPKRSSWKNGKRPKQRERADGDFLSLAFKIITLAKLFLPLFPNVEQSFFSGVVFITILRVAGSKLHYITGEKSSSVSALYHHYHYPIIIDHPCFANCVVLSSPSFMGIIIIIIAPHSM